jgi:hypothetical protein
MILLILFFALFSQPCCETNEWNGIIPLKSTRADVEKLLGKPLRPSNNAAQYKTKTENVMIVYAEKPCGVRPMSPGNSPNALVVIMEVNPIVRPKISDLTIDPAKFTKTFDESKNQIVYRNLQDGITVAEDSRDHTVFQIGYSPEKKFAEEFCRNNK